MKLSQYAKRAGVTYKTAWRWRNKGLLDASQTPTGTVIVREPVLPAPPPGRVARYARVSSADQAADRDRQLQRLRDYAAANGDSVAKAISEMASGLNDHRPKLSRLLTDPTMGTLVVEQRDRLTRFGAEDIRQLLETQGRQLDGLLPSDPEDELVDDSDPEDELVDDFVAVLTSLAARLFGRRTAKRRAAHMQACVKRCVEQAEAV
jgi:predicted site-specific integrase-resolvase